MTDETKISKDDKVMDVQSQLARVLCDNAALFQQLSESERHFRRLAKSVWAVQEDERRRVARELHDGLGQTLTALKIQIEVLAKDLTRPDGAEEKKVNEMLALAGRALNDARELSHLLRPQVLDDLGLVSALQWLCRTIKERTGFEVTLKAGEEEDRLDPEVETAVFRIVQEGLTNAMKHSGASRAEVRLSREEGSLRLLVRDGGQGPAPGPSARAGRLLLGRGAGQHARPDRIPRRPISSGLRAGHGNHGGGDPAPGHGRGSAP